MEILDTIPQLTAMRLGVEMQFTVKLRGFSIKLRPLSINEIVEVVHKTNQRLEALPKTAKTQLTEHVIFGQETLSRASTPSIEDQRAILNEGILGKLTEAELSLLLKEYNAGCDLVNPVLERMTQKQLQELLDLVKKSPVAEKTQEEVRSQLTELSFWELVSLSEALLLSTGSQTDK